MKKPKLYDVVRSAQPIGKIPVGTKGTVLMIHGSGQDCEVEFVDEFHNTLAVVTVSAIDLQLDLPPCTGNVPQPTREGRE